MNHAEKVLKNKESGMSLLEVIPLIIVMASLLGFLLGFWGMTHKNILHSISARNYAFETFRNRANLIYFSGTGGPLGVFHDSEMRVHMTGVSKPEKFTALATPFRFPANKKGVDSEELHTEAIWQPNRIVAGEEIKPSSGSYPQLNQMTHAWVMVSYGICINSNCGSQ